MVNNPQWHSVHCSTVLDYLSRTVVRRAYSRPPSEATLPGQRQEGTCLRTLSSLPINLQIFMYNKSKPKERKELNYLVRRYELLSYTKHI